MMRRLLCTLPKALMLLTLAVISQQSSAELAAPLDTNRSAWVAQTATHAGRVRVVITKQRPKFYLAKLLPKFYADNQDNDYYDDLPEVQVGYRRPELIDQSADVELSDAIKIRLALARLKALRRYEATWS